MRILALSAWWPEPADNGSRIRIARLLRALAREHEVHLVAFAQAPVQPQQLERMRTICATVQAIPHTWYTPQPRAVVASLWRAEPASTRATYNAAFAAAVQERAATLRPDVVIAFELAVAPYAQLVPRTPRIFEEVEVSVLLEQFTGARNPLRRARSGLTWLKHRRYMRSLLQGFDACTVVSASERAHVLQIAPQVPVIVLPNGADVGTPPAFGAAPTPDTLIYPGALSFSANHDAVEHFVTEIFPLIRRNRPGAQLRVTGLATAPQRASLTRAGVEFTGYVSDIRSEIAQSWAEVVPLRIGGGTRLKVLEALAIGTPVVATSKGVEGLAVRDGQHVLIADTPSAFAAATLRLLACPDLRAQLVAGGRALVAAHYDWQQIGDQLCAVVHEVSERHRRRT